jgi:uncharacterized protein
MTTDRVEAGPEARKDVLKHLILQLHTGAAPQAVQTQLVRLLGQVPYGLVVEVEQELIEDGMPPSEVTRLCHLHSAALEGAIDVSGRRAVPPGHPADVLSKENAALAEELARLERTCEAIAALPDGASAAKLLVAARGHLGALADVEKHYLRKEYLLFPFLEKHGITGPPQVMWGKHDEARALLRGAHGTLGGAGADAASARAIVEGALRPVARAVREMIDKEELILLPMSLDTLDAREWWEIARGSDEYGWCLVEPEADWRPEGIDAAAAEVPAAGARVKLPAGSLSQPELEALLGALPIDATFVDAEDRVRWFSHGPERVFSRSKAVLGRKVQFCHPPSSVGTVERILAAFRAGEKDRAAFWIQLRGRFVHIEYRALRGADGAYLGCLEVTQDLTEKRALEGERRLLAWDAPEPGAASVAAATCPGHDASVVASAPSVRPAWLDPTSIVKRLDARPLLASGVHPVQQVMADLGALGPGEVYELVTPFVPGPLLERAGALGCLGHSEETGPGTFATWFTRGGAA